MQKASGYLYITEIISTMSINYTTLSLIRPTGEVKYVLPDGSIAEIKPEGPVCVDRFDPFQLVPVIPSRAAEVTLLPSAARLTPGIIEEMMSGAAQQFRAKMGLNDQMEIPTAALWIEFRDGVPKRHQFLMAGEQLEIEFPLSSYFGKVPDYMEPEEAANLRVVARQKMIAIKFKSGSHVTDWAPIEQMFPDSLAVQGLDVDWTKVDPLWVCWALKASPQSNLEMDLQLVLEALPCGKVEMDKLSRESRSVIKGGAVKTFLLWSVRTFWFQPSATHFLPMTPGIHVNNREDPLSLTP